MAIITVTNLSDSGSGSLREAIAAAESGDTIRFSSGLANKTIKLTSGNIEISKDITIDGSNAANLSISGSKASNIFQIDKFKSVTINGLNFVDGRNVIAGEKPGQGGAIKVRDYGTLVVESSDFANNVAERGGAIQVGYSGRLTVRSSTFDGNDGSVSEDGFSAGAIATFGSGVGDTKGFLNIEGSTFTNNTGQNGGAVYSLLGPVDIKNSTFKNNKAGAGGAVFTDGGGVNIIDTHVEGNISRGPGGALFLWTYRDDALVIEDSVIDGNTSRNNSGGAMRVGPNGSLNIQDSTISNNSALKQGGAVWVDSKGSVTIEGTTFSNNGVTEDVGGGIFMNTPSGTPVKIKNSTFVDHQTGRDAATIWTNGGNSSDVTLTNTVFAGEGSVNFVMKDGGGNIAESSIGGRQITDKATYVEDVMLSELRWVGDKLVHVPKDGSPLIKAGQDIGAFDADADSRPSPPPAPEGGTGGNDTIGFNDGDDFIEAGAGDDFVYAAGQGSGPITVNLGSGDDGFWAPAGDNRVIGTGNNTIGIGTGNDTVNTKNGDDFVYSVNGGGGTNALNLGHGANSVYVEGGSYMITAGSGADEIALGLGTDRVNAGAGDNVIYMVEAAAAGDKSITAGAGNDYVETGAGNDFIDAGTGFNTLFSGAGEDQILVRRDAYNFIGDFESGTDKIALSEISFKDLTFSQGTGANAKDAFALLDNKVLLQASNIAVEAFNNDNNFVAA